jgi:hypothetical protein
MCLPKSATSSGVLSIFPIEAERCKLDAKMEEYYQQIDAEDFENEMDT